MTIPLNLLDVVALLLAVFALGGLAGHRFLPSRDSPRHVWLEQREVAWTSWVELVWERLPDAVQSSALIALKTHAEGPPRR